VLQRYGVRKTVVFGSFARGESREGSDMDIFVELEEGESLLDLAGLKVELGDVLGRRLDEVLKEVLSPAKLLELHKKLPLDVYGTLRTFFASIEGTFRRLVRRPQ